MPRIKLYITYDGTGYHGWQRQKNTTHTIQEVLESKLSIIANARVSLMSSGRTDTGVHARIQVVHGTVPEHVTRLIDQPSPVIAGESRLKQSLNSLLPARIRVLHVERTHDDFHAVAWVQKKTYVYFIDTGAVQLPELRNYSWGLRLPLRWPEMEAATRDLVGRHDFKAFCGKGSKVKSTVRTIHEARWGTTLWRGMAAERELRVFRVTGSGFLKHMVRSLVGTLVHIGNGKASPDVVRRAVESRDRAMAGPTAPAHGLWLWDILYKSP